MSTASLLKRWSKISDPMMALQEIVAHEEFLGYDPYYRDLRVALLEMAERSISRTPPVTSHENKGVTR